MSISQKIEKYYKNRIKSIKNMPNGIDKDMAIGSLVADLGKKSITAVSKALKCCFRKVKKCYEFFCNGYKQLSIELRGRKKITQHYPNLIEDIEKVIEEYKKVDSHFKTETLFISINPTSIINELVIKYGYPKNFACYNTIHDLLIEMGYKFHKIPKSEVINKIPETDLIFENVNEELDSVKLMDDDTAAISIDDKATKKIGRLSDNGKTWTDIKALDHDTIYDYSIKPFGILDLKTNETFVTCTPYSSTSKFKVDCIERYIKYKNRTTKLKKIVIFLDNGPENSGRRKLWLKSLVELSQKYSIVIKLVYYPPYHSKYNKIERYWARVQMCWNKVIIDSLDKLMEILNKITWMNIQSKGYLNTKQYKTGIVVLDSKMEEINKHIIREEGLEKWSIVITPYVN